MKRVLGVVLVLIAGALLCGCGGSDKSKDNGLRSVIGGKQASAVDERQAFAGCELLALGGE